MLMKLQVVIETKGKMVSVWAASVRPFLKAVAA
jgi:hypothetical protein